MMHGQKYIKLGLYMVIYIKRT